MLTFGEFVLAGWPAMLMWAPCSNGSCSRNLWQRRQFRCLFHHHLRTHHVLHHTWCWSVTSFSITRFSFLWFLANIPTPLLSNGLKRRGIDDHIARNLSRRSCQLCQGTKGNKDNLHDCCLAAKLLLWDLKWLWLNGALCHSIYTRLSSLSFFLKLKLTACLCILALWPECDGTHNFERYRYRYFFPVPDIFDTDTDTFFRYQILTIPIPILFSGTKFWRYRYRYFFPVPDFADTDTDTFFRYPKCTIPVPIPSIYTKTF